MRWISILVLSYIACTTKPPTASNKEISRCETVHALVSAYQNSTDLSPDARAGNAWFTIRYNADCFSDDEILLANEELMRLQREVQ